MKEIDRRRAGFTMMEVLIGSVILLIGFLPVYMLIFTTEKSSIETLRTVEAMNCAHALLEEIKCIGRRHIPITDGRVSDDEFVSLFRNASPRATPPFRKFPPDRAASFERSVETFDEDGLTRIKVYVVDRRTNTRSAGKRGETVLEAVAAW